MNNEVETSMSEAVIWNKRKDALLDFVTKESRAAKDEIETLERTLEGAAGKGVRSIEEDLAELRELKDRLNEDVGLDNINEWSFFLNVYEQRQRKICHRLLEFLIMFTDDAADFLQPSSEHKEGYSRRHLWRVLLNRASTDLQIIPAAVKQRAPRKDDQIYQEVSSKNTLLKADIISEQALGQSVERGFLQKTPVITYLKQNVSIRTVPYSEVVLIGVAYASMEPGFGQPNEEGVSFSKVSRDMLAIPHEVGHHLYRKGQIPGKNQSVSSTLKERLRRSQIWEWDWRSDWLEEIFADAYGCLVAGPVMALSFQDLLSDNPPAQISVDTGHHPIPALRPYIQTRILREITDANGNSLYKLAPMRLDEQWEKWLTDNFSREWANVNPLELDYKLHGIANPVKGQQILDGLDEIIKIVLWTLGGKRPPEADADWTHGDWKAWTKDVKDGEDPLVLYDNLTFEKFFPFSSNWFQTPVDDIWTTEPEKWPEQILSGWSVKEPEDHGG